VLWAPDTKKEKRDIIDDDFIFNDKTDGFLWFFGELFCKLERIFKLLHVNFLKIYTLKPDYGVN
jgi:hypothetical protein